MPRALHHDRPVSSQAPQGCEVGCEVGCEAGCGQPELLLYNDGCPSSWPPPAALLVTPVEVLDEHCSSPALLEPFLLVVTSELALDENGRLGHLFVKGILQGHRRDRTVTKGAGGLRLRR